jgi:hypothetical protein
MDIAAHTADVPDRHFRPIPGREYRQFHFILERNNIFPTPSKQKHAHPDKKILIERKITLQLPSMGKRKYM